MEHGEQFIKELITRAEILGKNKRYIAIDDSSLDLRKWLVDDIKKAIIQIKPFTRIRRGKLEKVRPHRRELKEIEKEMKKDKELVIKKFGVKDEQLLFSGIQELGRFLYGYLWTILDPKHERFKSTVMSGQKYLTGIDAEFPTDLSVATLKQIRHEFFKGKKVWRGISDQPADPGDFGVGTYYTTSKAVARSYGKVHEFIVFLYNPLVLTEKEAYEFIAERFGTVRGPNRKKAALLVTKHLQSKGYDGIVAVGKNRLEIVKFPNEKEVERLLAEVERLEKLEAEEQEITIEDVEKLLNRFSRRYGRSDEYITLNVWYEDWDRWRDWKKVRDEVLRDVTKKLREKGVGYVDLLNLKLQLLLDVESSKKENFYPVVVYVSSGPDDKDTVGLWMHEDGRFEMFEGNDEATAATRALVNKLLNLGDKKVKVWTAQPQAVVWKILSGEIPEGIYVSPMKEHAEKYLFEDRELVSFRIPLKKINQESDIDWKVVKAEEEIAYENALREVSVGGTKETRQMLKEIIEKDPWIIENLQEMIRKNEGEKLVLYRWSKGKPLQGIESFTYKKDIAEKMGADIVMEVPVKAIVGHSKYQSNVMWRSVGEGEVLVDIDKLKTLQSGIEKAVEMGVNKYVIKLKNILRKSFKIGKRVPWKVGNKLVWCIVGNNGDLLVKGAKAKDIVNIGTMIKIDNGKNVGIVTAIGKDGVTARDAKKKKYQILWNDVEMIVKRGNKNENSERIDDEK